VENLWMTRGTAVHCALATTFFRRCTEKTGGIALAQCTFRNPFRLHGRPRSVESLARHRHACDVGCVVKVNPLRYHQTINGRSFVIEVLQVGQDRWRAQIAGPPGRTTALMPFYGSTPEEAAAQLSAWLRRAGGTAPPAADRAGEIAKLISRA
jgi:hypothetical protein